MCFGSAAILWTFDALLYEKKSSGFRDGGSLKTGILKHTIVPSSISSKSMFYTWSGKFLQSLVLLTRCKLSINKSDILRSYRCCTKVSKFGWGGFLLIWPLSIYRISFSDNKINDDRKYIQVDFLLRLLHQMVFKSTGI